ncbi:amidohydrolase family protein [Kribbella sp. NPDC048915]|uniref:metal-dependent hydrolase family protein n=1 Tax=Kribbella sp. NPDC048915 TaxID=3155148 RepID=UPI0033DA1EFE
MATSGSVVFRDVRVVDVRNGRTGEPTQVVVRDGVIESIGAAGDVPDDARAIDGAGKTLIPGLIDAHWHSMFAAAPLALAMMGDIGYLHILAATAAGETVRRGFTTVRDVGGPSFGLKQAIDGGLVPGPRIFPSGAMISQTGGHGDFRIRHEVPRGRMGHLSHAELVGAVRIADGVDAVFEAAREQLMLGASQLKLMAGGGVASAYDPLDVTQYTEAELHAAVDAAENWGTYVMVHAYTPRAVQQAIHAGVKCIEHGQLLDDETAAMMAEHGIWWSLQPFLDDEDAIPVPPHSQSKYEQMVRGTETAYELARKHEVRLAWGTDTLFEPALAVKQGKQLAKLTKWFEPAEVLAMATVTNAELLALSGPRNPYPGVLGVVEEGALADLILVNGDPLDDIQLLATPDTAFAVVMKQGVVVAEGGTQ